MADPNAVFQNCYYVGNNFNAILYGVELVLYFATVSIIVQRREREKRENRLFLHFSTGLLAMITIYVAVQAVFGEEMWIVHADYPGGSAQYLADNAAVWYQTMGSAASVVLNLMSDGLLLYRCYVVWGDIRVILFPSILYLATAALGILTCYVSGVPNSDFFVGKAAQIALAYSSVVIGLNFVVSTLICVRIAYLAKYVRQTLGDDAAKMYTGVAALIVEAALPYTLFGLAYVIALGINSPTSILFLSIYVMFTCVSPQMIVLRVLMGRAWTRHAMTQTVTHMQFTTPVGFLPGSESEEVAPSGSTTVDLRTFSRAGSRCSSNDHVSSKV